MSSYKYGNYDVRPVGLQLKYKEGCEGKWIALATIIRWNEDEVLRVPVSWCLPEFETEQEAKIYAAKAAKEMIDAGLCKI